MKFINLRKVLVSLMISSLLFSGSVFADQQPPGGLVTPTLDGLDIQGPVFSSVGDVIFSDRVKILWSDDDGDGDDDTGSYIAFLATAAANIVGLPDNPDPAHLGIAAVGLPLWISSPGVDINAGDNFTVRSNNGANDLSQIFVVDPGTDEVDVKVVKQGQNQNWEGLGTLEFWAETLGFHGDVEIENLNISGAIANSGFGSSELLLDDDVKIANNKDLDVGTIKKSGSSPVYIEDDLKVHGEITGSGQLLYLAKTEIEDVLNLNASGFWDPILRISNYNNGFKELEIKPDEIISNYSDLDIRADGYDVNIKSPLTVLYNADLQSGLNVGGDADFDGDLVVDGDLTVNGNTILNSQVVVGYLDSSTTGFKISFLACPSGTRVISCNSQVGNPFDTEGLNTYFIGPDDGNGCMGSYQQTGNTDVTLTIQAQCL